MKSQKTTSFDMTPLLEIISSSRPLDLRWELLCGEIDVPATLRAAPLWLPQIASLLDATWADHAQGSTSCCVYRAPPAAR
jgi:hypothetical protein